MRTRIRVALTFALAAAVPLAGQVSGSPVITNVTPGQATAGAPGPITFTITGQALTGISTPVVTLRMPTTQYVGDLAVTSATASQVTAVLALPPPLEGGYEIIVGTYVAAAFVSSAPYPVTFNPPVQPIAGANLTVYAGVPFTRQLTGYGGTPPYTWSFSGNAPPGVSLTRDGVLSGTFPAPTMTSIGVMLTDVFQSSASWGIMLYVEPPPMTITSPVILPDAYLGRPYSFTFTARGAPAPYYWMSGAISTDVPDPGAPGLSLSRDGVLSGIPTRIGEFSELVSVSSSQGGSATGTFQIRVLAWLPLSLPGAELPAATAGEPYSYQFSAEGGIGPYTFSGTAPAGTTLGSSGLLSGRPSAEGSVSFEITVTDAQGAVASQGFALAVGPPVFRIANEVLQNARIGTAYADTLKASGGTAPFAWSIATGTLPDGLALDGATGRLSGSPTKGGLFRAEFRATDAKLATASRTLTILVVVPPIEITTAQLPAAELKQPYTATLAANGGEAPLSWTLAGGLLPEGLKLDPSGVLSGAATSKGSFAFSVTAADASGQKTSRGFEITVTNAALRITTPALGAATAGTAYSAALSAEGGTGGYLWSGAELPAGLSLNAQSGAITGSPVMPGQYTVRIDVRDEAGSSASRSYTLNIAPPGLNAALNAAPAAAGQQATAEIVITKYPVHVAARLSMVFTPDSGFSDDPAVQFAGGGRTADVLIAAGATGVSTPFQVGTTPGTIRITAAFTAAGTDVTPQPAPERTIRIERGVPVISSVTVTRNTGGFTVAVTGFATGRDITSATFRLGTAGSGTLQGSEFTVQVGPAFTSWFASDAARPFGGQFRYAQPFSVQGDPGAITSVAVTLANSLGSSQSLSATF